MSTRKQDTRMQISNLDAAGCDVIYQEQISGTARERPQLDRLAAELQPGDQVVVWRLDRLGRSTVHLLGLMEQWAERGITVRSINEGIDTSTPTGSLVIKLLSVLAEFERSAIIERTEAGRQAARDAGVRFGPPEKLNRKQRAAAARAVIDGEASIRSTAARYGVNRSVIRRAVDLARRES